jgi:hypothetical protein
VSLETELPALPPVPLRAVPAPPGAPPPRVAPRFPAALAFGGYLLVSFALFGVPVLALFTTRFAGAGRGDGRFFAWALAWWPHALAVGIDPFRARAVWFPQGIDLAWVTGVPGPSLAAAPVTAWLGPIASSNVLTILAPALSGLGAFLLARRLSSRFWPAFVGGYLFAFGSYEIAQLRGHVNLFLVFPVPLAAYLFVRAVEGSIGERAFSLLFALALVVQFTISIEVFATATAFGALAVGGVLLLGPRELRGPVLHALAGAGLGYAGALLALSAYLYELAVGNPVVGHPPVDASIDLLSFVLPRPATLLGGQALARVTSHLPTNTSEDGGYLGAPVLAVLGLSAVRARRDRVTRLLLLLAGAAALAALGPELHVYGHEVMALPWAVATHLPLLRFALPQRFTMYMWLAVGLLFTRWLDGTSVDAWRRYGVAWLAAATLLPNVASHDLREPQPVPALFQTPEAVRRLAPPGRSLLVLHPFKGQDMLWQAESGFSFAMAQGHMGNEPAGFRGDHVWGAIRDGHPEDVGPMAFLEFLREHHVSAVVVSPGAVAEWGPLLASAGLNGVEMDGVRVYRTSSARRCLLGAGSRRRPCSDPAPRGSHKAGAAGGAGVG